MKKILLLALAFISLNAFAQIECTASSGDAAMGADGNKNTRWESAHGSDSVWWMINYNEAHAFNAVKIIWEGAYAKSFKIQGSNNGTDFTDLYEVTGQALTGFPYTQVLSLQNTVSYQYVRFLGVERGTIYGYSFWEFETYTAQTSVLTELDFSAAAAIAKVGEGTVALTATPKDQYGQAMTASVTYAVSPASAGHVVNGVYYADAAGMATITATAGEIIKTVSIFNYSGENVALNKAVIGTGFNDSTRVNDGNDATEFQCDPTNGTENLNVTCGFTIDLGAVYDLNLVTIHFEGACSDAYTLETSLDNETFALAHSFTGTLNINNHTDFLYGDNLANATGVRYLRFTSTKNSTQWGMKIFEFQAFGIEAESPVTSLHEAETNQAKGETIKTIQNGQLVIIRNGIRYNASGQIVK